MRRNDQVPAIIHSTRIRSAFSSSIGGLRWPAHSKARPPISGAMLRIHLTGYISPITENGPCKEYLSSSPIIDVNYSRDF